MGYYNSVSRIAFGRCIRCLYVQVTTAAKEYSEVKKVLLSWHKVNMGVTDRNTVEQWKTMRATKVFFGKPIDNNCDKNPANVLYLLSEKSSYARKFSLKATAHMLQMHLFSLLKRIKMRNYNLLIMTIETCYVQWSLAILNNIKYYYHILSQTIYQKHY